MPRKLPRRRPSRNATQALDQKPEEEFTTEVRDFYSDPVSNDATEWDHREYVEI